MNAGVEVVSYKLCAGGVKMPFFQYWMQEIVSEAAANGISVFRGFEAGSVAEAEEWAHALLQTAGGNGLCAVDIPIRPWHKLSDGKALAVPVLNELVTDYLKSDNSTRGEWKSGHEGVDFAWSYLAGQPAGNRQSAAASLVISFLRGQKPHASLTAVHGFKKLRNPLSERNAETFLRASLTGAGYAGGRGSLLVFHQTEAWQTQAGSYQQLKLKECAASIRRWIDWTVTAAGTGAVICMILEQTLWEALMNAYPPLKQRISELRRPPKEPYRSPLQRLTTSGGPLAVRSEMSQIFSDTTQKSLIPIRQTSGMDKEQLTARSLIDAVRMGLVPRDGRRSMTLGYEDIDRWLTTQAAAADRRLPPAMIIDAVSGTYGSGKSHFLAVFAEWMQTQGWTTVRTELDGSYCSLRDPLTWFRSVVRGLPETLWQYWLKAAGNMPKGWFDASAVERPDAIRAWLQCFDQMGQMVSGTGQTDLAEQAEELAARIVSIILSDGSPWQDNEIREWQQQFPGIALSRIKCWIGRTVGQRPEDLQAALEAIVWIVSSAGSKGLWIAIDECDQEARTLADDPEMQSRASAVYQRLLHTRGPVRITLGIVPQHVFSDPLAVQFEQGVIRSGGSVFHLPQYGPEDRVKLAERLFEYYRNAYRLDKPFNPNLVKEFDRMLLKQAEAGMDLIRLFVKWYLHLLDTVFGPRPA